MSEKKQQSAKPRFGLILSLLFVEFVLIVFSIITQTIWKIDQSLYINLGLGIITIIILLIIVGLTGRVNKRISKTQQIGGELLDQASVIIESIGEGVLAIDEKSNISLINPEAKKISGWTDDALEMNYQTVLQLVDNTNQPIDDAINPIVIAQKTSEAQTSRELSLKTVSGKIVPIHLQVSPVANSASLVVAFRDIKLELEKERQQLEFISTASHEMRTPVAAIDGYLGLISNPKICTIDEKAMDYATKAKASSKHLGDLFKNLLDISKVEDGRLRANLEAIDMIEFTKQLVENLLPIAETKSLFITFIPSENRRGETKLKQSLYVQADRQMLTESISNLIENAVKYTKEGGVEINVLPNKQDEIVVSVKDSGVGIPKEDLPHLFQKFYRVDNRDTREINGTGLGLYLTRRMIEHMHGRIWVESELGAGSTFYIALARLGQKQVKQLLSTEQVQPEDPATKPIDTAPSEATTIVAESVPETTPLVAHEEVPSVPAPTEAKASEPTTPDTNRVLSRESAERLRQLGYNTTDFTVAEEHPWETRP